MTTNVEDDVDCSRDSVEMLIAKMTESKNKTKTTKMFQPKLKQKRNDEVTKQQCKSRKSHQATQWTTASCNNSGRSKHCNPRTNEPRQLEVDRHCYISLLHMTTDGCLLSAVSCLLFAFAAAAAVPSRDNCTLLTMNRNWCELMRAHVHTHNFTWHHIWYSGSCHSSCNMAGNNGSCWTSIMSEIENREITIFYTNSRIYVRMCTCVYMCVCGQALIIATRTVCPALASL